MKLLQLLLIVLLPATVFADNSTVMCEPGEETCSECYELLAFQVTRHDKNLYNVQRIFFPPNKPPPDFVIIFYHFNKSEDDNIIMPEAYYVNESTPQEDNVTEVWFWTTSTFYIFQPLHVFQFTSLFFSIVAVDHHSTLHLILPSDCQNAPGEFKQLLAQRVRAIEYNCLFVVKLRGGQHVITTNAYFQTLSTLILYT